MHFDLQAYVSLQTCIYIRKRIISGATCMCAYILHVSDALSINKDPLHFAIVPQLQRISIYIYMYIFIYVYKSVLEWLIPIKLTAPPCTAYDYMFTIVCSSGESDIQATTACATSCSNTLSYYLAR